MFPESPDKLLALPAPEFKKALAVAVSSASPNKSAAFGGVVQLVSLPLGLEDEVSRGYRIVGTDSLVLTVVTVQTPVFEFKTLLNLTAASVVQLMDGTTLVLGETNKHVQVTCGNTTVYATRPSQKYPGFDALLGPEPSVRFKINPEEFLSAIRTVEPLIEDIDKGHISLLFQEGVVYCSSIGVGNTASDEATYEQILPDPVFEPIKIENLRLLAKHLTGFLGRSGKEATISMTGKDKPVRLESDGVVVLTMPFVVKGKK
jgi:DNA polymerase III sliding clamp (beta) subunit (PCNA family)